MSRRNPKMQLTPNFSLEEFTSSATSITLGIPNDPTPEHLGHLKATALGMETVRRLLNAPVRVHSGYRSAAINKAVKGTPTSAHLTGWACDFTAKGYTPAEIMYALDRALPYDQLILEADRRIVHISFDPRLRMETRTQKGGPGTELLHGIHP